ncbi:uncharacterized protein LOC126966853 [Leptidea sinapis]|uniref:uncharacterized protein LOC126966853 n=1 Tax=Leptidea sinapis TaxID=189913 RepID=UPI0021C4A708|nr:uncharacterized protein LOC126966853 [Leptidea sinapis]
MYTRSKRRNICATCTHTIKVKEYLECTNCNNTFDLKCASITLKRYNSMSTDKRLKWKCHKCRKSSTQEIKNLSNTEQLTQSISFDKTISNISNLSSKNTLTLHNQSLENITFCSSMKDLHNSTFRDVSTCSLPDLGTVESSQVLDLKQDLATLSGQLESAHEEIAKLNIENTKQRKLIEENEKQIKLLKTLLSDGNSSINSTPLRTKTKKSKRTPSVKSSIQNNIISHKAIEQIPINLENAPAVPLNSEFNKKLAQKSTNIQRKSGRKIYIIGSQQSKNLSSALIQSRRTNPYEKYTIEAFIKPDATTGDILKSCELYDFSCNDKLILTVGENDCDPIKISSDLYTKINSLPQVHIIVTSVTFSRHLNELKLNDMLRLICNKFPNCTFLNLDENIYRNNTPYYNICHKINLVIDQIDYNKRFLNFKKQRHINRSTLKGTIPYYFKKVTHGVTSKNDQTLNSSQDAPKKGTIPFYFKPNKVDDSKNGEKLFFRAKN